MFYRDARVTVHEMSDYINRILNFRDPGTCSHSERVAAVSLQIARQMGLPDEIVEKLHIAAHLHDIGKIGIPDIVLLKTGKLDKSEYLIMQKHPVIGHYILDRTPLFEGIADMVLYHHERFDGKGYPAGLIGEDIPIESRIIAVADSFDALTSNRPYRPGQTFDFAFKEINSCSGSQFCPSCLEHFNKIFDNLQQVLEEAENIIIKNNTEIDFLFEEKVIKGIGSSR